jgi:uncharacterized protein YbjT (DUF2867 family)
MSMKLVSNSTVLIIGGSGYVGSYLATRLLHHGAHISFLSRSPIT